MQENTMIIGADFAPIEKDGERILQGNMNEVVSEEVVELVKTAFFSVFNLEAPVINGGTAIEKDGPALHIKEGTERIFELFKVGLLSLANNHIMDYGMDGLHKTMHRLEEINIPYIGVGDTMQKADTFFVKEISSKKIGFYSVADHEFSIADETGGGANGFSFDRTYTRIQSIKKECDYLVVLYHGGRELYQYPSPALQKICHSMANAGADIIICQHSHCIGAMEEWNQCQIFYGQGNFIFGDAEYPICENSILIKITVADTLQTEVIPIKREGNQVVLLHGDEKTKVIQKYEQLSKEIQTPEFIEQEYQRMTEGAIASYLYQFAGWPLFLIRFDKLLGRRLIKHSFRKNRKRLLYLQNVLQCEAHRELVTTGLQLLRTKDSL